MISNHFLFKDLVNHPTETSNKSINNGLFRVFNVAMFQRFNLPGSPTATALGSLDVSWKNASRGFTGENNWGEVETSNKKKTPATNNLEDSGLKMVLFDFSKFEIDMCWGLNSHCFPMVGMVINLIVGVYIPSIRIPIQGGMTIPNIRSFDCGTYGNLGDIIYPVLKYRHVNCHLSRQMIIIQQPGLSYLKKVDSLTKLALASLCITPRQRDEKGSV